MNEDILRANWKQVQGDVKNFWGKLTDDDLMSIDGSSEKLLGVLQARYGYSKDEAKDEFAWFLSKVEIKLRQTEKQV